MSLLEFIFSIVSPFLEVVGALFVGVVHIMGFIITIVAPPLGLLLTAILAGGVLGSAISDSSLLQEVSVRAKARTLGMVGLILIFSFHPYWDDHGKFRGVYFVFAEKPLNANYSIPMLIWEILILVTAVIFIMHNTPQKENKGKA